MINLGIIPMMFNVFKNEANEISNFTIQFLTAMWMNLSLKKESIADKSIKDIRQLAETKTMKNCTIYSATKQPTINDFELQKSLGEGKFGTVYQAVHR